MGDAVVKEDRNAGVSSQLPGETLNSEMGAFIPQGFEKVSRDCNIFLLTFSVDKLKLLHGGDI